MKRGITIFDFIMSVMVITALGQLLVSSANVLATQSEKEIINGVKSISHSYIAKAKAECKLNGVNDWDETTTMFNNYTIEINSRCSLENANLYNVVVTACLAGDYCYESRSFYYAR